MINLEAVGATGYDVQNAIEYRQISSVTGRETVPVIKVERLLALGRERINFPVLAFSLPRNMQVDGLLGLDFLHGGILQIDFRLGTVELN